MIKNFDDNNFFYSIIYTNIFYLYFYRTFKIKKKYYQFVINIFLMCAFKIHTVEFAYNNAGHNDS